MSESRVVTSKELRGILLPVGSHNLLLPNAAVAELIGYQEPEAEADRPDWWLGRIEWRGMRIPVISLEQAMGRDAPKRSQRVRIAVVNSLNGNPELPYIGLLTIGISRLARVSVVNLELDPGGAVDTPLVLESVKLGEQLAWIPDLDQLEQLVLAEV